MSECVTCLWWDDFLEGLWGYCRAQQEGRINFLMDLSDVPEQVPITRHDFGCVHHARKGIARTEGDSNE